MSGLGKTLQAIEMVKACPIIGLVVAPAMLVHNWKSEFEKFSDLKVKINPKETDHDYAVAIISYSQLHKYEWLFDAVDIVVADELHYVKNPEAKRTKLFHQYLKQSLPDRFIGLTGTPIKNRVGEWYSLLALCSYNPNNNSGKKITDKFNYWTFQRHFSHEHTFEVHGRRVTKYEGHKNVDELRTYLEGKYLRRKASEVLDLPPIVRKDILIDPDYIDKEMLEAWNNRDDENFMKCKVNSALIKASHTVKYVKELWDQGEEPIVIFSSHVAPAREVAKKLKIPYVDGSVSLERRDEIVKQFQAGKHRAIVATTGALSVGVTLTRARNLIFNDFPFVPGDIAQAEKRIHRIGQEGSCVIHRMLYGKIDRKISADLDKKIAVLREAM